MNILLVLLVISINIKFSTSDSICIDQLDHLKLNYDRNYLWAQEFYDSWGHYPSGVFSGNYFDYGHYDQCVKFYHQSELYGYIQGQHCMVMFSQEINNRIQGKFAPEPYRTKITIGIGICLPVTCTMNEIKYIANQTALSIANQTISEAYSPELFCSKRRESVELGGLEIFAICVFSLFTALIACSTLYEFYSSYRESKVNPLFSSFSLYSNSKLILTMKTIDKDIIFLHGIRALSIIWIVLGHSFLTTYWYFPNYNGNEIYEWFKKMQNMLILSGNMGVDTFFLLSSMLLTISVFRELDKSGSINLPMLYIKRYIRITVPFAACILFAVTFFYHVSTGPMWNVTTKHAVIGLCKDYWWTSLLYVSNYVNPGKLCFGHSWYLLVDMQLYFLSPLILYPLWRYRNYRKLSIASMFIIASVSIIYVFVVVLVDEFRTSIMFENKSVRDAKVYYQTFSRLDSWMMGILTGYIMHEIEGKIVKLSRKIVIFGWTISILAILGIIFGQYPLQQVDFNSNPFIADAFFDSFKRIFWCLAISWIIIACQISYGGPVKRFLSLSAWLPISKLSFCIYLLHLPIQTIYIASIRQPQIISSMNTIYKFFGDFSITFFVAFAWALTFEYPVLRVMKVYLDTRKIKSASS